MEEFITIQEAVKISGKSDSSLRRLVKRLVKVNSSEIKKIYTAQGHHWLIKRSILDNVSVIKTKMNNSEYEATSQPTSQSDQIITPQNTTNNSKGLTTDTNSTSQPTSQKSKNVDSTVQFTLLLDVLRDQLIVKDKQLAEKDKQLAEKDKHIADLVTRQGETNLLLHNFQVKLLDRGEENVEKVAEEPIEVTVNPVKRKKTSKTLQKHKKKKKFQKSKSRPQSDPQQIKDNKSRKGFMSWLLGE